ncbi:MAG: hypothetical protein AAGE18_11930 [Pseudomonadota bacterium]
MDRVRHEVFRRRGSGNALIGLILAAFVALIFGVTIVKFSTTGPVEGFDHVYRPALEAQSQ